MVVKEALPSLAYEKESIGLLFTIFVDSRCLIDFEGDEDDEGKILLAKTHVLELLRMSRVSKRTSRSCIAVMSAIGSTGSVSAR